MIVTFKLSWWNHSSKCFLLTLSTMWSWITNSIHQILLSCLSTTILVRVYCRTQILQMTFMDYTGWSCSILTVVYKVIVSSYLWPWYHNFGLLPRKTSLISTNGKMRSKVLPSSLFRSGCATNNWWRVRVNAHGENIGQHVSFVWWVEWGSLKGDLGCQLLQKIRARWLKLCFSCMLKC